MVTVDTIVTGRRATSVETEVFVRRLTAYSSSVALYTWCLAALEEVWEESMSPSPESTYLAAEEYPALADLWDNDADAIYDDL
jgi:hypothetical protein